MSNFDTSSVTGLIGLWDFRNGNELADTGTDDGVAQNGWLHGNTNISGDRAHFDGHGDYFDVDGEIIGGSTGDSPNAGDDDPFDMSSGTIEVQFTQDAHVGSSPDSLVNRGEFADRGSEGYFNISINEDGGINLIHCSNGEDAWFSTDAGIVNPGDLVNVRYTWDENTGVELHVENLTTGTTDTVTLNTTGLTMDIGDNDDDSWTFGAREEDDGDMDQFFDGSIDYVAIYEEARDAGPVDGTAGDDVMLAGFVDAQGDTIDGDDGDDDTVFGYAGNDVIAGGEGTNTLFGGTGDDVFIGGAGADSFEGDAGQDNLDYSNSSAAVNVNLTTGALSGGDADNDSIIGGIDGVIGSDHDDTLIGFDHSSSNPADTFTNQLFGGAGDDYIEGRGDDDLLEGGAGADEIYGGDGDDVIRGGGDSGGETHREALEWNEQGDFTNGGTVSGFTQNTGNVDVTFTILNADPGVANTYETDDQNVSGILSDGGSVDDNSSFESVTNGEGNEGDYRLSFSDPVENVSFRVNDIDGDGIVTVTAYDLAGNPITVNLTGGSELTLSDTDGVAGNDTADSNGGYLPDSSSEYSILVSIPGPVSRIEINHDQDGGNNSGINLTDVYFDATVPGSGDLGDTLFGDAGDDLVYGDAGGDTIDGGEGADELFGGADADRFNVGSAAEGTGDIVDGGTDGDDNDVLDLSNVGPFRIINETVDPDGDSTSGTVEFLDPATGAVTGTMDFSEIEEIIGSPVAPDGTVHGTAGDDDMSPGYVDPQMDTIDGADGDDDIIEAGAGNDKVDAGDGNDLVYAGSGDDEVKGGEGDDTIFGEDGNDKLNGEDGNDTLFGGAGDDELKGYRGDDALFGGDGNDTLEGKYGSDTLDGGDGDDELDGGDDNDTIYGGDGNDSADGGDGDDYIDVSGPADSPDQGYPGEYPADTDPLDDRDEVDGGYGNDTILTGDDNDSIKGGKGEDTIYAGADDDTVDGGEDNDFIVGGEGNDTIEGKYGDDVIYGDNVGADPVDLPDEVDLDTNNNIDTIYAGKGNDSVFGGDDADFIDGGDDNDYLDGGNDDDVMFGDYGDDTFVGGHGADTMYGGKDQDRFNVTSAADGNGDLVDGGDDGTDYDVLDLTGAGNFRIINETTDPDGNSTSGTIEFINGSGDVTGTLDFTEIEEIIGDEIVPDGTVHGTDGNDVMNPGYVDPQMDTIDGDDGDDDIIEAGAGDDIVNAGNGNDTVFGGTGDDTLNGQEGNDTLYGEDGEDVLNGGNGEDELFGGADDDVLNGNAGNDTLDGGDGDDTIDGGNNDDSIIGGDGSDSVLGGQGNDVIDTSGPVDPANDIGTPDRGYPGLYNDDADPNNDRDVVDGGNGDDIITTGDDNDTIFGGAGADTIYAGVDDDSVSGGNDDDVIVGGEGNDDIDGGQGNDVIYGGLESTDILDIPDDVDLRPDNGLDTIHGGNGDDTIYGRDDDDLLYGDDGNDDLYGGIDDDTMFGGQGADSFDGGEGEDEMYGGNDRDTFTPLSAADAIGDLADGGAGGDDYDVLDLSNVGPFQIIDRTVDPDGNSTSGTVQFLDPVSGDVIGEMQFSEIESIIGTGGPDGTVHGTAGDDFMDVGYIDTQGDTIDGDDGDDDIIEAGGGNDTVNAGDGDDTVFGGDGDDTLNGGQGDDTLYGEDGDDRLFGDNGTDTLFGGAGNDTLNGNEDGDELHGDEGDDTLNGSVGADTLFGGDDDDVLNGNGGNDTIFGGDGNDVADGGNGDDIIDTSGPVSLDPNDPTGKPDQDYPGLYVADDDPFNDLDTVFGGAGDDIITTGDDDDSIDGGDGNDTIYAGFDDDTIAGGTGDDYIEGGEGNDEIEGGDGNDTIFGGLDDGFDVLNIPDDGGDLRPDNGDDIIYGGAGNDVIDGKDDSDTIYGGDDDDTITGGIDDDTLYGDDGNDTFNDDHGVDESYGGAGADTFNLGTVENAFGDHVDGGTDGDDNDVLNMTGLGTFQIINETVDADGDSTSGTIQFLDTPGGAVIGEMTFSEIETIVPCFTPGTMIATMEGEKLVENLKTGDRIITRDNGAQEIRWIGAKPLTGAQLQANPHLQPVLIRKGALGNGLPERDMLVSPNHRVLVNNAEVGLLFNEPEVLAAAKHLINPMDGIQSVLASQTTYIHFMFDHHEVVLSNGAWTESFQPGDQAMAGVSDAQRDEITELFPELFASEGREAYSSARLSLKKHEAKMLRK